MKVRSTKVDAGDFKHELLNRLRSTMAVNVLRSEGQVGVRYRDHVMELYVIKLQRKSFGVGGMCCLLLVKCNRLGGRGMDLLLLEDT